MNNSAGYKSITSTLKSRNCTYKNNKCIDDLLDICYDIYQTCHVPNSILCFTDIRFINIFKEAFLTSSFLPNDLYKKFLVHIIMNKINRDMAYDQFIYLLLITFEQESVTGIIPIFNKDIVNHIKLLEQNVLQYCDEIIQTNPRKRSKNIIENIESIKHNIQLIIDNETRDGYTISNSRINLLLTPYLVYNGLI